jgi:hypothetical protein
MVPVAIAGNISGEATTRSGNIFNEATRGAEDPPANAVATVLRDSERRLGIDEI